MPVRIDENTLYGLKELPKLLDGTVSLPTLLDRLGLRDQRCFKGALWGWEIIEASRKAPPFSETNQAGAAVVNMARGGGEDKRSAKGGTTRRLTPDDLRE